MAVQIIASGANIDFVNSILKVLPDVCESVYCLPLFGSLKEAAATMPGVDYFLLCLDKERDNTVTAYRKALNDGILGEAELVIVGKAEACRVISKDSAFISAHFFERPISVKDFREYMSRPIERKKPEPVHTVSKAALADDPQDEAILRKKHILIIDDELQQVLLIKSLLATYYEITAVTNGLDARKFLANHTVDLILMDYVMPGENGSDVFSSLKLDPDTADIPVLFLTSVNDADTVMSIINLKPAGYLVKPVRRSDLVSRIIDIMDSHDKAQAQRY